MRHHLSTPLASPATSRIALALRPIVVAGLLAALGSLGCTSFSFKKTGKGTAPDELKDRSAMVKVGGGTFDMGAPSSEPDEYPPHSVEIASFMMDKTEVTIRDYSRCVEAKTCRAPSVADRSEGTTDDHPIVGVSWYDAKKYCEWVGKRLPTEAEWEYAARAPHFGAFPWQAKFDVGLVNLRGDQDGYDRTAPVGSFPRGASGLGLLDMAGNVGEWTADWYETTYYGKVSGLIVNGDDDDGEEKKPVTNLRKVTNPTGPEASTGSRVVRGGSWSDNDYLARSTARLGVDPNLSNDAIGFRCAADR